MNPKETPLNSSTTTLSGTKKTPLQQLSDWLTANEKIIKRGGIAEEAGIDKGTLSRLLTGKRGGREETINCLISAAKKHGFILY